MCAPPKLRLFPLDGRGNYQAWRTRQLDGAVLRVGWRMDFGKGKEVYRKLGGNFVGVTGVQKNCILSELLEIDF